MCSMTWQAPSISPLAWAVAHEMSELIQASTGNKLNFDALCWHVVRPSNTHDSTTPIWSRRLTRHHARPSIIRCSTTLNPSISLMCC
jgi:hypothetical protein